MASEPAYLNPDVTTHLDTADLDRSSPRSVSSGVRGSGPPATTKVAITAVTGWENSVILVLTGNELDARAELVERSVHRYTEAVDGVDAVAIDRIGQVQRDPDTRGESSSRELGDRTSHPDYVTTAHPADRHARDDTSS